MLKMVKTDSNNKDFINLVKSLDNYLADKDGDEHSFFAQYNKLDLIKNVIVAYEEEIPVGCGAIKEYELGIMEVKRMFTKPDFRGKGIASKVLSELENWAVELSYNKCILETGKKQIEAVALYKRKGYTIIPNYGQYAGVDSSYCFQKKLNQ